MTNYANEKNTAIAISFSIAVAFVATTDVQATTQFPPAHTTAQFNETGAISEGQVAGSYYRPTSDRIEVRFQRGDVELAYSSAGIAPYYRAAN